MKKLTTLLLTAAIALSACTSPTPAPTDEPTPDGSAPLIMQTTPATANTTPNAGFYRTLNHDEVVGVWISFIELTGIFSQGRTYGRNSHVQQTEAQFRAAFAEVLDNCVSLGINTVYVHLRPFGDAVYESEHFPWSKFITGDIGRVPTFDPLEIMLEESHAREISFHGWLNPMRIQHSADMALVSQDYLIGQWYACDEKRGTYIVEHQGNWYLNPAYEEVRELIANGVREITERYNVDAIHIDDYFYPTVDSSFDEAVFTDSQAASLADFRRTNVNAMVRSMHDSAKRGNPNALFGISPAAGLSSNRDKLFADVELWAQNAGFADYIIPQIYFGFNHPTLPFVETAQKWAALTANSPVKLMFGLSVYKIGTEDTNAGSDPASRLEWRNETEILRRQIEFVQTLPEYSGVVFFSYNFLFNKGHVTPAIEAEIAAMAGVLN